MTETTAMQIYEGQVTNLTGKTGNLNIIPLTKANAHRVTLIRRKDTNAAPLSFHFRKKSTGMHMYIHTYDENGVEKELKQADFKDWVVVRFKHPGYLEGVEKPLMMPTVGILLNRKSKQKQTS